MTDTTATPAPFWWTAVTAMVPYMGQVAVLLATFATGMVAQHYVSKPADPPAKAQAQLAPPLVRLGDVDDIITQRCSALESKVSQILSVLAPKGTPAKPR